MYNKLLIDWQDEFNTNIKIIDEQHRGVISAINTLFFFKQEGQPIEVLMPALITLDQVTRNHFMTEENILLHSQYPHFKDHVKLHREMINMMEKKASEEECCENAEHLFTFLKEWWYDHIVVQDKKYMECVLKTIEKYE